MVNIQLIGFEKSEIDMFEFNRIINEHINKLRRKLKNIDSIIIHLKEYNREGNRQKFSFHIRVNGSFKPFEASSDDWDFNRALHKIFIKLENEVESSFKVSDQHKKRSSS